jgi:uncharacterized protein YdiU (UPF0061 family)
VIQHFPEEIKSIADEKARYLAFYREIVRRTAILVAQWQSIGKKYECILLL